MTRWFHCFLCLVGLLAWNGCARWRAGNQAALETAPLRAGPTPSPHLRGSVNASSEADEDILDRELEQRAEANARYLTGLTYELNEQPEKALDEFYASAWTDPGNESLVFDVSRQLIRNREFDKALSLLKRATASKEASGILFSLLGLTQAQLGHTAEAAAANRKAVQKAPGLLSGYENLFQLQLQNNQPAEALRILDEAARVPSKDPSFWIGLAEMYSNYLRLRVGETAAIKPRIVAFLTKALDLKPSNPTVLNKLADGLYLMGEMHTAARLYLDLLSKYPSAPGVREKLTEIYIRTGEREKAATELEQIVRENPTHAQAYYFLGSLAYEDKHYEQASDYFGKALNLNPDYDRVYFDLAGLDITLNKIPEALDVLDRARAKFPDNFFVEFYSGLARNRQKEYREALKNFTAAEVLAGARDTNRLNHLFYYQAGIAYEGVQNYPQAEQYFKKCLALDPDYAPALNYLGYMWVEHDTNLAEARLLIERALKVEPNNAAFLDSLGWVLFKQNQPQQALDQLLQAIKQADGEDATLYDHLGDIYQLLKEPEKARESWRKSLALEPNDQVKKKLDASASPGSVRK